MWQKKRILIVERREVVRDKVENGPQSETHLRMCLDFTDLNKAYPKDSYPLPYVDMVIDGASKNEILTMIDAHSSYN